MLTTFLNKTISLCYATTRHLAHPPYPVSLMPSLV